MCDRNDPPARPHACLCAAQARPSTVSTVLRLTDADYGAHLSGCGWTCTELNRLLMEQLHAVRSKAENPWEVTVQHFPGRSVKVQAALRRHAFCCALMHLGCPGLQVSVQAIEIFGKTRHHLVTASAAKAGV